MNTIRLASRVLPLCAAILLVASTLAAQAPGRGGAPGGAAVGAPNGNTPDPLPPIDAMAGRITVKVQEFATIPSADQTAPRLMLMTDEPGTRRLFVNDMRGPIFSVSYDGRTVTQYIDLNDPQWNVQVQSQGRERGVQSFAFHPQFAQQGTPGYGHFYTWLDTRDMAGTPDFLPGNGQASHHMVLLEWVARNPAAATYDGGAPREMLRYAHPFSNHNGGMLAFNPTARPGSPDFGLLYMGVADGGSGGDPLNNAQKLSNGFGKIFRIDPMGRNSANGKYGIVAANRFAADNDPNTLGEIYAYGVRNPQRFGWDANNGNMFMSDIGQNTVEEISPVTNGANLGWNVWEGSYRFGQGGVSPASPRSDPSMTYPVVEYDQVDPLVMNQSAATGVVVNRASAVPVLRNKVLLADFPSGEVFWFDADNLPRGGHTDMHRVVFDDGSGVEPRRILDIIRAKTIEQGRANPATRADLRFGQGADGRVFLINKADGIIRVIVP